MPSDVRNMFDAVAHRYDLLNRILSAGRDGSWRRKAADCLPRLEAGSRLLDWCGGTGDFCLAARRRGIGSFCVLGDFSRPMLARAKGKSGAKATPVQMDALRSPFRDACFQAVLCGFGMRNLADLEAGVGEAFRLLVPGGTFITLEFFRPKVGLAGLFYGFLAPVLMPLAGRIFGSRPSAYAYLAQSINGFRTAEEFAALCRGCGFASAEIKSLDFGVAHIVRAVKAG